MRGLLIRNLVPPRMLRHVVLLRSEGRQAGDEHEALVALEAADFGGVNQIAAEGLVGFRIGSVCTLKKLLDLQRERGAEPAPP